MVDEAAYGERPSWRPARPRLRPLRLAIAWLSAAVAFFVAAWIVPGATVSSYWGALGTVLVVAIINAILPPVIAALRIPFTAILGLVVVLCLDAAMLLVADNLTDGALSVSSFWSALAVSLVAAAVGVVLDVALGTNDDDVYAFRVVQRIARRTGGRTVTGTPGIVFLEVDGLAYPVLQLAMRSGYAPTMARWLADGTHRLSEWETDLSSQTGAAQAGILLGSNDDIPAFRWVEKETGRIMTCSNPRDCAEIERRHATGQGLLADGGASRGNLLSGEADEVILTVSRMDEEKRGNPGYRAFLANGFNVTRAFVLFGWEIVLEWTAAARARRRKVRPIGHRGGRYPFLRAVVCVIVRDLIVYGVLSDMMKGRPAVYATFSSYDEVAHHSGLERADTMEALRKLDEQFARIERARPYAARPYEIVVLSDHGQTQGATFLQRNGYTLEELVRRSVATQRVSGVASGDENDRAVGRAVHEATGAAAAEAEEPRDVDADVVVLGSGNLGLVYLMDSQERLTREAIDERYPDLLPSLRAHPHIGWLLVQSGEHGPVVLGATGASYLAEGRAEGDDPLAVFSPTSRRHLLRAGGFEHAPDIFVGSFYDAMLDEGCAFEELISFHGGLGGSQTRPFLLSPVGLPLPDERVLGAESVHRLLAGWRQLLGGEPRAQPSEAPPATVTAS